MENHSFLSLVSKRQSVRKYHNQPVEPEKLTRCLEAARLAPSASNSQPWKFVVVTDPELQKKVAVETYGPLSTFNTFVSAGTCHCGNRHRKDEDHHADRGSFEGPGISPDRHRDCCRAFLSPGCRRRTWHLHAGLVQRRTHQGTSQDPQAQAAWAC